MMTGCGPARHGVFDHRYYDAAAGQMKVNHSGRVRVPTFWHLLSAGGPVGRQPERAGDLSAARRPGRGRLGDGRPAPRRRALGRPRVRRAAPGRGPRLHLRYFWKRAPLSLDELAENARLTAESFRGRAEGGLLADQVVPDWSALMVQFQNLDPFQHRAWRYLNVDETGIDDPAWNAAAGAVMRGLDEAIGLLCELADRRGAGDPGRQRPRLRPLPGPDPRQPDPDRRRASPGCRVVSGRLGRRARQAVDHFRLWGAKRDDPEARASSFDLSVAAQFPFDWKRTLAFAPHQDTAAMIYLNSADRRPPGPRSRPRARSTTPAPPPSPPWPRRGTPRPASPSSRRSSRPPRPTGSTPPAKATPT